MKREVGKTATIQVPLSGEDALRWVDVYVCVNAKTDSNIAARAVEGRLHDLGPDGLLAQPYVFHDPDKAVFALVVPSVLRHRFFLERAALLETLHASGAELPDYIVEARAVVGTTGLRELLRNKDALRADIKAQQDEVAKERELLESHRAEVLKSSEEVDALRRELEQREEELDARFERLREREKARLARTVPAADDEPSNDAEPTRVVDSASITRSRDADEDDEEFAEVDLGSVEDLDDDGTLVDDAMVEDVEDAVEEVPDMGADVIQLDLVEPIDDASLESVLLEEEEEEEPEGAIPAPQSLLSDPSAQMVAEELESGPYLFARLQEGDDPEAFSKVAELLVQYVVVDERPVVLLALTDFSAERPYPRRAALDPRSEADEQFLKKLSKNEPVSVALYSPSGRYRWEFKTTLGDRCTNLETILERVPRATGTLDASTALERALAAAPPVHMKGHPFVDAEAAGSPKDALRQVGILAKWAKPEKRDLALLALSIPEGRINEGFRRILDDALRFGLMVPPPLGSRAVSLGIADEPGALILRSIKNFRETARAGNGLSTVEVGKNWEALLEAANQLELSVEPEAHEQAQRDIARGRGDSVRPPAPLNDDLATLEDAALLAIADHPRRRLAVAQELVQRGDDDHLKAVAASMRKMGREELLAIVVALVARGEGCMDALIDGLDAKKTFVRQGCALGLGELGQRRGVGPLVQLLQTEPSDSWHEIAWIVGRFGTSTLRPLERAVKNPKGPEERAHTAMAHLLENDDSALGSFSVKDAVSAAEKLRESVRAYRLERDEEQKPLTPAAFSQAFFRAISKAST